MTNKAVSDDPLDSQDQSQMDPVFRRSIIITLCFAVFLRLCTSTHPYSGMHVAPMYGDYEAQRHWMEVTIHLPTEAWYKNGPNNNLSYWGLDYPPLSGYQSWICGKFIELFEPQAVELTSSHGYETQSSKLLMRFTVIMSDILCYLPACIACALVLYSSKSERMRSLVAMALNPALIVIDHGHFQYNAISLGLAAGAVAAIVSKRPLLGSFLFCASLSHKQMSLYFAPAIFAHLLGQCFRQKGILRKIGLLGALGTTVIASFGLLWSPFVGSIDSFSAVLSRIFPTQRGLFEDYVANFWCISSLVIKWKRLFSRDTLFAMCTGATFLAFLPSAVKETVHPTPRSFLLCMATTALSFFMFSFQVHEKSILLPLLPLTMLINTRNGSQASLIHAVMLSMYPLLEKDGLQEAYWGLLFIHLGLTILLGSMREHHRTTGTLEKHSKSNLPTIPWRHSPLLSLLVMATLHVIRATVQAPAKYPFLWDAMMVSWAGVNFAETFLQLYAEQIM